MINENPQVKFYFVSIWNDGQDGRAMLHKFGIAAQPNVTILADPGPRRGENKIKQFAGLPLSLDSDDLDLQRRRSPLRIELRRGSFSCAPTISDRQPVGMVAQRRAVDRVTLISRRVPQLPPLHTDKSARDPFAHRRYAAGGGQRSSTPGRVSFFSNLKIKIRVDRSRTGSRCR